jgi:hypothetical protein
LRTKATLGRENPSGQEQRLYRMKRLIPSLLLGSVLALTSTASAQQTAAEIEREEYERVRAYRALDKWLDPWIDKHLSYHINPHFIVAQRNPRIPRHFQGAVTSLIAFKALECYKNSLYFQVHLLDPENSVFNTEIFIGRDEIKVDLAWLIKQKEADLNRWQAAYEQEEQTRVAQQKLGRHWEHQAYLELIHTPQRRLGEHWRKEACYQEIEASRVRDGAIRAKNELARQEKVEAERKKTRAKNELARQEKAEAERKKTWDEMMRQERGER